MRRVNAVIPVATAVGVAAVEVSASGSNKIWTEVSAGSGNTGTIYLGGHGTNPTVANGYGELRTRESIRIDGGSSIWAISDAASQEVRVLEGHST